MQFTTVFKTKTKKFTGVSHSEILNRLMTWIEQNNEGPLDRAYWLNRIKNQTVDIERKKIKEKRTPKLSETWHAGLALMNRMVGNTPDQAEHKRRADICSKCPMKSETSICYGCGGAGKLSSLISSISKLTTRVIVVDKRMRDKYCSICDCSLALLTVTNIDGLKEKQEINRIRPIGCWMRVGGPNYIAAPKK